MIDRLDPELFFTVDEIDQLAASIREVESQTSGRICLHLERRCPLTDPMSRAIKLFHRLNLGRTKDRNAVLFYFATEHRLFAVLGDEGFSRNVPPAFWRDLKTKMIRHFVEERIFDGTLSAVREIGASLLEKFPQAKETQESGR